MMSHPAEPQPWSVRRWSVAIAIVFAIQVASVFWLEDRSVPHPRRPVAPVFRFSHSGMDELLALQDPTLFALPHLRGFSGTAWLITKPLGFPPALWPEPERFLALDTHTLGAAFESFVRTNLPPSFAVIPNVHPEPVLVDYVPIAPQSRESRLRIEGDLARRKLLTVPHLASWTNADFLTNSIVQLLVDGKGNTVSCVLLRQPSVTPSVVQDEADQQALRLARSARFQPASSLPAADFDSPAGLCIGKMIFEWQTIPAPPTNSLAGP